MDFLVKKVTFSNHESRLLLQSHTFAIIVILDLKIQSMWIHWPFFPKTWTKGHWPLDDLWPPVCWGHMCDSTQGSLCPSPMTIHQCMWIQWSILQNTTYIHTYYIHTTDILRTYYVQNEWSHSLLLDSVQVRQKLVDTFSESCTCSCRGHSLWGHLDLYIQHCVESLPVTWPLIREWSCDSRSL